MVVIRLDDPLSAEQWLPVAGYPDYEVSNLGRVRRSTEGRASAAGRLMTACNHPMGYKIVVLRTGDAMKRRTVLVHRLVAAAFLGTHPSRPHVNHKDFDRTNNRADNLEWCTQLENVRHAFAASRRTSPNMKGERNTNTRLTDDDIRDIRSLRSGGVSRADLARRYGITPAQVWVIATKRQWRHV